MMPDGSLQVPPQTKGHCHSKQLHKVRESICVHLFQSVPEIRWMQLSGQSGNEHTVDFQMIEQAMGYSGRNIVL